jgi:hypothetical protein
MRYDEAKMRYDEAKARFLPNASKRSKIKLEAAENSFLEPDVPVFARQFLQAVKSEQHLALKEWLIIIKRMIASTQAGEALCREIFQDFSAALPVESDPPSDPKSFRMRPIGPVCNPDVRCFGRIQAFSKLASAYAAYFQQTEDDARSNLKDDLIDLAKKPAAMLGVNFPLGNFLMWSTFDHRDKSADPFRPRPKTVADLLDEMGMKSGNANFLSGETFVLTAYCLPANLKPHIPTIFEAYAGQPNYYFRPIERRGSLSGLAWPIEDSTRPGRAEVVHGIVFANCLTAVPEIKFLSGGL